MILPVSFKTEILHTRSISKGFFFPKNGNPFFAEKKKAFTEDTVTDKDAYVLVYEKQEAWENLGEDQLRTTVAVIDFFIELVNGRR